MSDQPKSRYYRIRSTGEPQVLGIPATALPWLKKAGELRGPAADDSAPPDEIGNGRIQVASAPDTDSLSEVAG